MSEATRNSICEVGSCCGWVSPRGRTPKAPKCLNTPSNKGRLATKPSLSFTHLGLSVAHLEGQLADVVSLFPGEGS